jgi:predicted RNA methylase
LDREFDRKYGVETCGIVHPSESVVAGSNWIHGIRYEPVDQVLFAHIIKELSIPYEEFIFVDFGSGKGRALLLAAGFPFKRIVGVEYCDDLNRIARQNLQHYPDASRLCKDIELVCMDAAEYRLPDEPLVLFFYNPFGRLVMEKMVKKVADSFQSNCRRIIIVYLTPEHADLWDDVGFLKRSHPGRAVWDTELIMVHS